VVENKDGMMRQLLTEFRLDTPVYDGNRKAEAYIKMILNMVLGLVSFISLILVIYSFYLIFFSKQEE
jgi:hypothetical protein